jgi:predicted dehydrogenase
MNADRVVINVLGAGRWGPNLIRNFTVGVRSFVGRVCDVDANRLKAIREKYPYIELSTDADEALTDPAAHAVAIITPVSTHYELTKKALLAGKDVFVEKPLALRAEECDELVELARAHGRILMVGHVFKFNPGIRFVKGLLEAGSIGKIISMHAIRTNLGPVRSDVNALWDLGAHDLSIFNYWLGSTPHRVTANGSRHLSPRLEDTVLATYVYPGEIMASLHVSWLHPRKVREITVVGEERMVVWNDMDLNEPVRIYDKGVDRGESLADTFGAFRLTLRDGMVTIPPVRGGEPLATECEHFIDCVQDRRTPLADGLDGLAVVRCLEAADASIRQESRSIPFTC